MNCCSECFKDKELKGFVFSNASDFGQCDFCASQSVDVIDPRELDEKFQQLIEIYEVHDSQSKDAEHIAPLYILIQREWKVFSTGLRCETHKQLMEAILSDSYAPNDKIFSAQYRRQGSLLKADKTAALERDWEGFASEIKNNNRFFLGKQIDLELLKELFKFHGKIYPKGKLFFRARISDSKGFSTREMGKPPPEKASPGRANPAGIPYLYLATSRQTALYECRANYLDYVTIVDFKLIQNLKVLRLRTVDDLSPFTLEGQIGDYLKYQEYLKRLETELSRPLRRNEQPLEYLPTQYLCEFVKFLGYDAIEYGSSLYPDGTNLAAFDDSLFEPVNTLIYEVISVDLKTVEVSADVSRKNDCFGYYGCKRFEVD